MPLNSLAQHDGRTMFASFRSDNVAAWRIERSIFLHVAPQVQGRSLCQAEGSFGW